MTTTNADLHYLTISHIRDISGNAYPNLQQELRGTFKFMGPEISRMWLMASGRITREEGDKYRP